MNKPWLVCFMLVAIFACGGVSGGLVAYRVARRNAWHHPSPEVWGARQMDRVTAGLRLTPAQVARIQPIVKRNIEELAALRRQSMRTSRKILERMEAEVAAELTPEQRIQYEQLLKQRRHERMRHLGQEWGPRGGRDRPAGEPPEEEPPPPPASSPEKSAGT